MWTDTKVDGVDYIWADDWNDMAIAITSFINSKGIANGLAPLDADALVPATYIPIATGATVGGIKVGNRLSITDGILSADEQGGSYTLPVATDTILGGIKVGSRLSITDGVLSADAQGGSYILPTATSDVLGGVKIGNGITITDGTISATTPIQSDWDQSSNSALDFIKNKPVIPAAQINSDWDAVNGVASILNKPTIPAAQINSDWTATEGISVILNKPTIPDAYVHPTTLQCTHDHNALYLGINATAFDSDKVDGMHANEFATVNHTHDYSGMYLGIKSKASDSELLDGLDSTSFATTEHLHTGIYEPFNNNIQSHVTSLHAPSNAEKNVQADWNQTTDTVDDFIKNKPTIPAAQVNSDWSATTGIAQILNKPTIPDAQVNSDWNAADGVASILNKPTIPSAQVQSDWNAIEGMGVILNKPALGTIASHNTDEFATTAHLHDAIYLGINAKATDSDKLDNHDSTYFAESTHNHDLAYLGISAKAADSNLLDGMDSTAFATVSHTHTHNNLTGLQGGTTDQYYHLTAAQHAISTDATITALAGITTSADKLIYATASDTFSTCDFTSAARTLLDDTTTAAMRATLAAASSTTATQSIYVDKAATGAGTGADWTNAFTTIQAAINSLPAIISHTVSIIVRKGSTAYSESLTIKRVIGAGQIIIRGEYYWYGTNTSSKTGKIDLGSGDTGYTDRAQIAAGDKVILMKYSGTVNASLPSDSYVDTVASVSGTEVTLTTNTGVAFDTTWAYTIVKTSLSGPSTTTLMITGTPSVLLFGLDITSGTYASVYAINSRGVSITGCYLYGAGSSIVTATNKSDVFISNSFVGSSANSAYGIYVSVQSYMSLITTVITMTTTGTYAINASYLSAISAQYNRISAAATGVIAQRNSFVYVGSVNDNGATTPKNPATSTDAARIE